MAQFTDQILVQLGLDSTKFKAGLTQATNAAKGFSKSLQAQSAQLAGLSIGAAFSFAAQKSFVEGTVKAAEMQEQAIARLSSNLKAEQRTRADSIKVLTDHASALQNVTRYGDETTVSAMAMLASFGLTTDQIVTLIPYVQDATENLTKLGDTEADLTKIAQGFGRAIANQSASALSRYGISLKLAEGETLDFKRLVDELSTSSIAGLSKEMGASASGAMKQYRNAVGDVKEELGFAFLPVLKDVSQNLIPLVQRMGAFVKEHQSLVRVLLGVAVGGAGAIAGVTAFALIVSQLPLLLTLATGPLGLVTAGFVALSAAVAMAIINVQKVPGTLEGVTDALDKARKSQASIADEIRRLSSLEGEFPGDPGGLNAAQVQRLRGLREEAKATADWIAKLEQARQSLEAVEKAKSASASLSMPTEAQEPQTPDEARKAAEHEAWRRRMGLDIPGGVGPRRPTKAEEWGVDERVRPILGEREEGFVGPPEAAMLEDQWRAALEGPVAAHDEYLAAIEEAEQEREDAQLERLARMHEAEVAHADALLGSWGATFMSILEAEKNFGAAMVKASFLMLIRVVHAQIQTALAELLVVKVKEVGKAVMGAPMSLGATLAAIPAILAGYAAATAGLAAVEKKLAPKGGYETGGVVPSTGVYLMHEGEVVFNPRRNSASDLASNLARAGASREAAAMARSMEQRPASVSMPVHFHGDIRSKADVEIALARYYRRLQASLGVGV